MHSDWKWPYSRRLQKARSERFRRMANGIWQRDRQRRLRLGLLRAEDYPNRIVRRIVVIDDEKDAREAVIFQWDSEREARRKTRKVLKR